MYLFSIGIGLGHLIGGLGVGVPYTTYIAPALLASAAMNGAIYDSTANVFYKLRYAKTYEAVLATPLGIADIALGEITWALLRGTLYAAVFLAVMAAMGLIISPWALLALPAATLIGFAFAAVGVVVTTYLRTWADFDWVQLVLLPLFLFSGTFYPLTRYPQALVGIVEATPLSHGVALLRDLVLGSVGVADAGHAAYLAAMALLALLFATRRFGALLRR